MATLLHILLALCFLGRESLNSLTSRQILLIRKHQQQTILHFPILNNPVQLLSRLIDTISVIRVNDENQTLCPREIMSPQRSNLVLSTDVPHVELDVLVCYRLNVEADCGNGGDSLVEAKLVKDRLTHVSRWPNCREAAARGRCRGRGRRALLVFPAASRPSMSNRISLEPKSLAYRCPSR